MGWVEAQPDAVPPTDTRPLALTIELVKSPERGDYDETITHPAAAACQWPRQGPLAQPGRPRGSSARGGLSGSRRSAVLSHASQAGKGAYRLVERGKTANFARLAQPLAKSY
ncbi:hypothetical protein SAMN05519104_7878 [Rhizobiales bacterium GAS188]|nr:hypothetical protein SAMN05519104_7878 [Rhizobiales bacterium GAS188]